MSDLPNALATILSGVQRPGDFQAGGTLDMHPFLLEAAGVGPLALPLLPAQAEQRVAVAEQAPRGQLRALHTAAGDGPGRPGAAAGRLRPGR
jgi:hypothetical protein